MTEQQYLILNKHRSIWNQWKSTSLCSLSHDVKIELAPIYKDFTGKNVNLFCSSCLLEMLKVIYNRLEDYEKAQIQAVEEFSKVEEKPTRPKRQRSLYKKVKPKTKK